MPTRRISVSVEINGALLLALRYHLEAMEAGCAEEDKKDYAAAILSVEAGKLDRLAKDELATLIMLRAGFSDIGTSSVGGWSPDNGYFAGWPGASSAMRKAIASMEK